MARRGHGEGSIYRRADGRWCAVLDLGYQGGKRRRKYLYADSQKEVRRLLDAARRQHEANALALGPSQTVEQYLKAWLDDTARHRVRPGTYRRYEELVRLYALPTLGRLPLAKLTPQHLSVLYGECLGARQDGKLSARSVEFLHRVLHVALKQAVLWRLIPHNSADAVAPPRPKRAEIHPLDEAQTAALLAAAAGHPLEALFVLAIATGMRQGELLGLRWQDVELDASRLQVRHTLTWRKGAVWELAEPKTGRSRRQVQLAPSAVAALRGHRARQAVQRLQLGEAWQEHGFVFTNAVGRPLDPSNLVHRVWPRLLKDAALPPHRFHDLRHTAATLLLKANVPVKVVSEMLGHATITLTLDTYSHVLPTMQADAAAQMERLLHPPAAS